MTFTGTLALSASLAVAPLAQGGSAVAQDTTPLAFLGIRAGAPLEELSAELRRRRGQLRCRQSKADPAVRECRGTLPDSVAGELAVWVSAIDGTAGVVTLSRPVSESALQAWQDDLARRYGNVKAATQGTQRMMQWVRRGRMLRLTWRRERSGPIASVSLVDGRVLDRWGRERSPDAPTAR